MFTLNKQVVAFDVKAGPWFPSCTGYAETDVVSEMTASRLVNDSPNSLTQFENEPVQVARKVRWRRENSSIQNDANL